MLGAYLSLNKCPSQAIQIIQIAFYLVAVHEFFIYVALYTMHP